MIDAISPLSPTLPAAPAAPVKPAAPKAPAARVDRLELSKPTAKSSDAQIKAYLAPAFDLLSKAGYGDYVRTLKNCKFKITDGTFGNTEYYAATSALNTVSLSQENFLRLGKNGQASVLLHESVHARQSIFKRTAATINQGYGLAPFKRNFAEMEAYKVQWASMARLGINERSADNELWYGVKDVLEEAGIIKPGK